MALSLHYFSVKRKFQLLERLCIWEWAKILAFNRPGKPPISVCGMAILLLEDQCRIQEITSSYSSGIWIKGPGSISRITQILDQPILHRNHAPVFQQNPKHLLSCR
jgi:hypothetical protein